MAPRLIRLVVGILHVHNHGLGHPRELGSPLDLIRVSIDVERWFASWAIGAVGVPAVGVHVGRDNDLGLSLAFCAASAAGRVEVL